MNIYQHLFILIPSVMLLWHGMSGEASCAKLFSTYLGLVIILMYPIIFIVFAVITLFSYLGTL